MKTISSLLQSTLLLVAFLGRIEARGVEGNFLRVGGTGEEGTDRATTLTTELKFHAQLEVDFFPGSGRRPKDGEINSFEMKTRDWFHDVFAVNPTFESFRLESVDTAYVEATPDLFFVTFTGVVEVGPGNVLFDAMTIEEVEELVDAADYEGFITDYIWKASPEGSNEFFQTHTVKLQGWQLDEQV